jgi:hypothetical protein
MKSGSTFKLSQLVSQQHLRLPAAVKVHRQLKMSPVTVKVTATVTTGQKMCIWEACLSVCCLGSSCCCECLHCVLSRKTDKSMAGYHPSLPFWMEKNILRQITKSMLIVELAARETSDF